MAMPLHLTVKLGTYLMKQKIKRVEKYPLIMELEPLFACNLKCGGCGKIQHPASVLKQRMPVEQAVAAVEECGAPMVSIAGGEPLMHPQIHVIAEELLKRKKFVVLCTNAVLLPKHIDKFKPNRNFAWMVHLDGIGEKHDEAVSKEGVFEQAVAAIKLAKQKGFQVYTNTTVFNTETPQDLIATLDYINDEPGSTGWKSRPETTPHKRICENCQKDFASKFSDARFCGRQCANSWHAKRRRPVPQQHQRICERCQADFASKFRDARFCSERCGNLWRHQNRKARQTAGDNSHESVS